MIIELIKSLVRNLQDSRTERKEYEHKETYKSQPYSVDPYLIAYAIEEQKKEEEERLKTVPTRSVAY